MLICGIMTDGSTWSQVKARYFIACLINDDIQRHAAGFLALIENQDPTLPRDDYFKKFVVTADYAQYPPVMSIIPCDFVLGLVEGEHEETRFLRDCQRNIRSFINSKMSDTNGSAIYTYSLGVGSLLWGFCPFSPPIVTPLSDERSLNTRNTRTTGQTEQGVLFPTTMDIVDFTLSASGLTTAVFSSPDPWKLIKKKVAECVSRGLTVGTRAEPQLMRIMGLLPYPEDFDDGY